MKTFLLQPLLCLFALSCWTDSYAATIVFHNRASFISNIEAPISVDFEGVAPANEYIPIDESATYFPGVKFNATSTFDQEVTVPDLYVTDGGFQGGAYSLDGSAALTGASACGPLSCSGTVTGRLTAILLSGVTAVGMEIGHDEGAYPLSFQIYLPDGIIYADTASRQGNFLGFISTTPISSLIIDTSTNFGPNYLLIDDFVYGNSLDNGSAGPSPVPESSSMTLLSLGLAGLGLHRVHCGSVRKSA